MLPKWFANKGTGDKNKKIRASLGSTSDLLKRRNRAMCLIIV